MSNSTAHRYYLGLISGTSADGIDAALVRFEDSDDASLQAELVAAHTLPWQPDIRARLVWLGQGGALDSLDELGELDAQVGEAFADAALAILDASGIERSHVAAIGSHGQTVRHRPYAAYPFSLQIGDAARIVERTGITTVADFRRRDIAAGGHGAPLLPALHHALLHDPTEQRAVLNLGGIANLTLLPREGAVRGFDTGPANALMDLWCHEHTGRPYDEAGAWGATGQADPALLERLLDDPWFAQPPPKSSGREHFQRKWLAPHLRSGTLAADVQATLRELTARTIADALRASQADTQRLLVCGGGVHNPVLMASLRDALPGVALASTAEFGLDPDHVEAMGFAWLARQTLRGKPGNLPTVTGAAGLRILGAIYPA
ncbi:anhydro-N-acetylmuramic acid kinase [Thermomonas sp. HDW16]|uniref:anhydro-N-acetylmuramic acid kinase n=1 Tax=Thermomonas sp. HDW16 TaxID=2714945 RepID=UPI00140DB3B1|nr:anhydro-N-acetylmuramic acid kinase [Thermomonas sp. HDW16]QIL19631.1 anhydro-N-acetylmuramic acid kinase [Thermomonas sp. HDW16]